MMAFVRRFFVSNMTNDNHGQNEYILNLNLRATEDNLGLINHPIDPLVGSCDFYGIVNVVKNCAIEILSVIGTHMKRDDISSPFSKIMVGSRLQLTNQDIQEIF
ncbi:hypothetical protein DAKH74_017540 [Maudiozyma humilis]|uniref:Uncharacterized protein n=1 Tax=Maudiozyma humilis TaxID=51915 RepID=A0AAV5RWY2_MAUHU|nr:hypothetical protein DAKH74_017540 [Kazachstania humilis]